MCRDCNGKYKFSFMEMITSGKDGSTSATGFIGVILSLVCILMAVAIFIFYFIIHAFANVLPSFASVFSIWISDFRETTGRTR